MAKGEERFVARVAKVKAGGARARPGEGELAHGFRLPEKHVSDAVAFRPGQPRGDDSVGLVQQIINGERPAGDQNHHHRNSRALQRIYNGHVFRRQVQILAVAPHLGIRQLSNDSHRRALRARAVARVADLGFARGLAHPLENCRPPARHLAALALPIDGPTSALIPDVVGVFAHHVDAPAFRERQHAAVVLEHYQRLADALARDGAMFGRAESLVQAAVGQKRPVRVHQSRREFHAQDARHGVVNARHRHAAFPRELGEKLDELAVVVRHHHHVHAGVDGGFDLLLVIAGQCLLRGVVGNQEALEAHLLFQDFGHKDAAGRAFDPVPTAIGRHDGGDACGDRGDVARQVNAAEVGVAQPRVALVERKVGGAAASREPRAEDRAAVAREMLGAGDHAQGIRKAGALKPLDRRRAEQSYHLRRFAEAFVRAPPAHVLWDGNAGPERPVDARGADFFRRHARRLFHELRASRRAQAHVLREHRRPDDVVVPMHGVNPVEQRNTPPRLERPRLVAVIKVGPGFQIVSRLGVGIATAQKRPQMVGLDVVEALQEHLVGLGHLPDFFFERQGGQQLADLRIKRRKALGFRHPRHGAETLARSEQRADCAERALKKLTASGGHENVLPSL